MKTIKFNRETFKLSDIKSLLSERGPPAKMEMHPSKGELPEEDYLIVTFLNNKSRTFSGQDAVTFYELFEKAINWDEWFRSDNLIVQLIRPSMRNYLYFRKSGVATIPEQFCEIEVTANLPNGFIFKAEGWISPGLARHYFAKRKLLPVSPESWWEIGVSTSRETAPPYTYRATWTHELGPIEAKAETEKPEDKKAEGSEGA